MTTLSFGYTVNMKAQCDDGYRQNVSPCCYVNCAFCVNRLGLCLYWPAIGSNLVPSEAKKRKMEACEEPWRLV